MEKYWTAEEAISKLIIRGLFYLNFVNCLNIFYIFLNHDLNQLVKIMVFIY